jgi:hypothetical protein
MVTIHREAGLRFVIFTDDHEPAHVHVFGEGSAKIDLGSEGSAPSLVWNVGMKAVTFARPCGLSFASRKCSWRKWREIHG